MLGVSFSEQASLPKNKDVGVQTFRHLVKQKQRSLNVLLTRFRYGSYPVSDIDLAPEIDLEECHQQDLRRLNDQHQ